MRQWPHLGESPLVQARRVANAYRAACLTEDPVATCHALDAQFSQWGQSWVVPRVVTHDPDEWLCARDAANLACISVDTLRQLRYRGRITGRKGASGWEYRVADLWKLGYSPRGRGSGVTDTLPDMGTAVPTDQIGGSQPHS